MPGHPESKKLEELKEQYKREILLLKEMEIKRWNEVLNHLQQLQSCDEVQRSQLIQNVQFLTETNKKKLLKSIDNANIQDDELVEQISNLVRSQNSESLKAEARNTPALVRVRPTALARVRLTALARVRPTALARTRFTLHRGLLCTRFTLDRRPLTCCLSRGPEERADKSTEISGSLTGMPAQVSPAGPECVRAGDECEGHLPKQQEVSSCKTQQF